jgi:hypothetical protein
MSNKHHTQSATLLGALNSPAGTEAIEAFDTTKQLSAYLALHTNPFNQTRGLDSPYSSKRKPVDIGAPPSRNVGPSRFVGGVYRYSGGAAIGTVDDSTTTQTITAWVMKTDSTMGHGEFFLDASASGHMSFTKYVHTFPNSENIVSHDGVNLKPWRNVAAGINVKQFQNPGSVSGGILSAFVINEHLDLSDVTLADLRQVSLASWEQPVSAGVTMRAPITYNSLLFDSHHDDGPWLVFVIEWDAGYLPHVLEFARYDQMNDSMQPTPAQHNMDTTTFSDIMQSIDYAEGTNIFGLPSIPLIVTGNSFWSTARKYLGRILTNIRKNPTIIGSLIGVAEAFLA